MKKFETTLMVMAITALVAVIAIIIFVDVQNGRQQKEAQIWASIHSLQAGENACFKTNGAFHVVSWKHQTSGTDAAWSGILFEAYKQQSATLMVSAKTRNLLFLLSEAGEQTLRPAEGGGWK